MLIKISFGLSLAQKKRATEIGAPCLRIHFYSMSMVSEI